METAKNKTTLIVPNPDYQMSSFERFFWGDHYRDAWTTPTTFPVLNLQTFAGGLKVEGTGRSGAQTKRLNFKGADGRRYAFRSIDKDPATVLPEEFRSTIAVDIIQDQISASHPAAAYITSYLEEELGIFHSNPHICVMPDDPALGEFRETFAGLLGQLVELPGDHLDANAIFAGADEVGDGNIVFERTRASASERVNAVALLKARLFDIFIGDWDRHRWQWRWVKPQGDSTWHPVPEDRDQAFSKLDGFFPSMAYMFSPQTVGFKETYPDIFNITFNGRELDRRFLVWLEKPAWDSVAASLRNQLTDELIETAVRQLPAEMYEVDGEEIEYRLKKRRNHLTAVALDFYAQIATTLEIHTTDQDDLIKIVQLGNERIEVSAAQRASSAAPYASRCFDLEETEEIRFRLHKGNDLVVINGSKKLPILIRILGGDGDDELHFETATSGVKFYDHSGNNRVTGDNTHHAGINDKPYEDWVFTPTNRAMPLQWGSWSMPAAVVGISGDFGLLLGYGRSFFNYGFRKEPFARRITVTGAVSSKLKWEVKADSDFRWENSRLHRTLQIKASTLDVVHFYGFGNDTRRFENDEFYEIDRWEIYLAPALSRQFGQKEKAPAGPMSYRRQTALTLGVSARFSSTKETRETIIASDPDLYGTGRFDQLAAFLQFKHDNRNMAASPTKGSTLNFKGTFFPKLWDVVETYGWIDANGSIYFSTPTPFEPVLAFRAGGKKIWGQFPYFDAAFIGGGESIRGLDKERFAGDASFYGSGELRLLLAEPKWLLMSHFGIFGFADAGRVYLDGASPGGLHWGYGGGIWVSLLGRPNTASLALANSDEDFKIYVEWGFSF